MIETVIDPRHPRRFEKKANIVAAHRLSLRTRLFLMSEREKFVSRKRIAQSEVIRHDQAETRLEIS
jgi:3-deoxy-D-manno-octulosonic-acid transferase